MKQSAASLNYLQLQFEMIVLVVLLASSSERQCLTREHIFYAS